MARYRKAFIVPVVLSLALGCWFAIVIAIMGGRSERVGSLVASGIRAFIIVLVVNVGVLATAIALDMLCTRDVPAKYRGQGVNQTRVLMVRGDPGRVHTLCASALRAIPRLRLVGDDPVRGTLSGRIGMSLSSWGEEIKVSIEELDAGRLTITVSSRPWFPTTLFDYGKNCMNVAAFVESLRSSDGVEVIAIN